MDALASDAVDSKARSAFQAPAWRTPWVEEVLEVIVVAFILVGVFAPIIMLQWTISSNVNLSKESPSKQDGAAISLTLIEAKAEQGGKVEGQVDSAFDNISESKVNVTDDTSKVHKAIDELKVNNALTDTADPNPRIEPKEKLLSENENSESKSTNNLNSVTTPTPITLQDKASYFELEEGVSDSKPIEEAISGNNGTRGAVVFDPNFRRDINQAEKQRSKATQKNRFNVGRDYVDSSGDLHVVADNGCEFRRSQSRLTAEDQWFFVGCEDPDEIKLRYSSTLAKPSFDRQR